MNPVNFLHFSYSLPAGIGAGTVSQVRTTTSQAAETSSGIAQSAGASTSEVTKPVNFEGSQGNINSRILEGACRALHYPQGLTGAVIDGLQGIKILQELGNGAMSQVYLVEYPTLYDAPVVLKLCKFNGRTTDPQTGYHSKRLGGEMLGLYLKESPYLLQTLGVLVLNVNQKLEFVVDPADMSVTDGVVLGIFTEYLEGSCDLFDAINSNSMNTTAKVHHVARSIAFGLYGLHTHYGFAHRDIKPENVLLDKHFNVKIIDYGFLRENKRTRSVQGTPYYVAPEIMVTDEKDYDPILSDAHSLAALFYTLRFGCFWNPYSQEPFETLSLFLAKYHYTNQKMSAYFPKDQKPLNLKDAEFFDLIEKLSFGDPEERWSVVKAVEEHPFFKQIDASDQEDEKAEEKPEPYAAALMHLNSAHTGADNTFEEAGESNGQSGSDA